VSHPLEDEYGLTSDELLDALARRFRAKVTLEGAVAEVQPGKRVQDLLDCKIIHRFEEHDEDGYPDYTIWTTKEPDRPLRIECKNVRNSDEAYREAGQIVAYKVETQKTRTSQGDPSSRFYGFSQFDILAVCLGKKPHDWTEFVFIETGKLSPHTKHPGKLAVMHRVPVGAANSAPPWYNNLADLLQEYRYE